MDKSNKDPIFSVIIPSYNHERYLGRAISSVMSQNFDNFELIVVDDGSKDRSLEVARDYQCERVFVFSQTNCGAGEAINAGIRRARGQYVCILNSDDEFDKSRLGECLSTFQKLKSVDAVFTNIVFVDDQGLEVGGLDVFAKSQAETFACKDMTERDKMVLRMFSGNFLHTTSNLVCRKSVFERVGLFQNFRYVSDYDFFLRLVSKVSIAVIGRGLLYYRYHSSNTLKEDSQLSIVETMSMIAQFVSAWKISNLSFEGRIALLEYLLGNFSLYGGERYFAILLAAYHLTDSLPDVAVIPTSDSSHPLVKRACYSIKEDVKMLNLEADLAWQRKQTDYWWGKYVEKKGRESVLSNQVAALELELSYLKGLRGQIRFLLKRLTNISLWKGGGYPD